LRNRASLRAVSINGHAGDDSDTDESEMVLDAVRAMTDKTTVRDFPEILQPKFDDDVSQLVFESSHLESIKFAGVMFPFFCEAWMNALGETAA
jgi:hypothetical protein